MRAGSEAVATGDLEHRVEVMGQDEVSEVAEAFNHMTRQIRISQAELADEIAERREAEAALQEAHAELESRVEARTQELSRANAALQAEIEDRGQAERALRESEAKHRRLIETMNQGLGMVDEHANVVYFNGNFCGMLGYSSNEVVGRHLMDFLDESNREILHEQLARRERGERESYEMAWTRKDGRKVATIVSPQPLFDEDGTFKGSFAVITDISDRKRAEEELQRSNADLEQFAYVASHDLQEPLRMVSSYVQLLERRYKDKLDEDANEFIAFAVDGAKRMQGLINGLLTYSRVGRRGKEFERNSCERTLERCLANLQTAIAESDASVTHDPLPEVMGDESQLAQLFQNLVGNAIKFRGGQPPKVHVSAKRLETRDTQSQMVQFSVSDSGIGMDPKHAERVFMVFQRLHTREEYPGTGMGLAICRKIVERHGGRIWAESEPGKGSTFHFTIPACGSAGPGAGQQVTASER